MKSNELRAQMAPFKLVSDKNALADAYKSLCFEPGKVRGCSNSVILEAVMNHGIENTVYINTTTFLAVVDSLPEKEEVAFNVEDGVLLWECGPAKGRIATIAIDNMPKISETPKGKKWKPTTEFARALDLGGMSCGSIAATSTGMYGIVIDAREDMCIYASDDVTISACFVTDGPKEGLFPPLTTIAPDAAALLSTVIESQESDMIVTEDAIFYTDEWCHLFIKQLSPVSKDIGGILDAFSGGEICVKVPPDRIMAFIKRAAALAEQRKQTYVGISAEDGRLLLSFDEGTASSDEWYLAEVENGVEIPDLDPIKVEALKLARALEHTTEIVLDHIDRHALVLRGYNPEFHYLVSGRR